MFQHRWRAQLDVSRVKCIQLLVVLPIERRARHHRRTAACYGVPSSPRPTFCREQILASRRRDSWLVGKQRSQQPFDSYQRIIKFGPHVFTEIPRKCRYTYVTRHAVPLSGLFSRSLCSVGTPSALRSAQRARAETRVEDALLCFVTGSPPTTGGRHAL